MCGFLALLFYHVCKVQSSQKKAALIKPLREQMNGLWGSVAL